MESIKKFFIVFFVSTLIFFVWASFVFAREDTTKVRELISSALDKSKSFTDVITITDEAIFLADKLNYLQGKADALNIKGRVYLKLGEYPNAMNAFWEELTLREKNPGWQNSSVGIVYVLIGESYRAIGNFDFSLEYIYRGLVLFEEKKDIAYAYNRLAAVYYEISYIKPDTVAGRKSEEFANKSLEISKDIGDIELTISTYNIIGGILSYKGKHDEALKCFFYALDEVDKDSTYTDKANILYNISNIYYVEKNYEKAIQYGLQSYNLSKKYGIKIYILMSARILCYSYAEMGDYKLAYSYSVESGNLHISIFDEKKSTIIYGLQKKYEEELKKKEEKEQTTKKYIIIFAVVLFGVIIAIAFYIRHRNLIIHSKELAIKNKLISEQKEALTKSNIAKDKYFSILSHDIRNPLNGILGFSNLLESEYDDINDDEKKEYIGYLKTSSESLFRLIDRLLIWSRLQTGRVDVNKEKVNLNEIISNTIDLQKANAIRKGIILENNVLENIFVIADKYVLEIVLRNILDNAVKFTSEGGTIAVRTETDGNNITVSVTDTGVGINPEDLNKIFLIDQKISSKGTDSEEGTGLGLILCKEMLELLSVTLKVESKKGRGSKFFFELPLSV